MGYFERIEPHLCDISVLLNEAIDEGKSILFEGAQGTHLDVDHGTYPFVTSSSTGAGGACTGCGVGPTRIDRVIGVAKAYTTRVGEGPFPTELDGDPVGELLQQRGQEFGATTGRVRRCGWFDASVVREAVRLSGISGLAITKLDVLDTLERIKIAVGYRDPEGNRFSTMPYHIGNWDQAICIRSTCVSVKPKQRQVSAHGSMKAPRCWTFNTGTSPCCEPHLGWCKQMPWCWRATPIRVSILNVCPG